MTDTQILADIISELTKAKENTNMAGEQVLAWTERVEAQGASVSSH